MSRLVSLSLTVPRVPWARLGLAQLDGSFRFADVLLDVTDVAGRDGIDTGLCGWSFDVDTTGDVDGIPTGVVTAAPRGSGGTVESPLLGGRLLAVDHVVVRTDDLERTSGSVEAELGAPLRRTRDAGGGVTQGFHRLDNTVIEIVQAPSNPAGASLWGFVGVVDDLDAVVAEMRREFGADAVSGPRDAVQAGQRIASIRRQAGLQVEVALMTSRPER